jgi:hypothetical protein
MRPYFFVPSLVEFIFRPKEIISRLQIQPELYLYSKIAPEPQSGIGGNRTLPLSYLTDPALWDTNILGQAIPGNVHRTKKLF